METATLKGKKKILVVNKDAKSNMAEGASGTPEPSED